MGPSPSARLLRAYGPLFAAAVLFLLMAAVVPTVGVTVRTVPVAGGADRSIPAAGGHVRTGAPDELATSVSGPAAATREAAAGSTVGSTASAPRDRPDARSSAAAAASPLPTAGARARSAAGSGPVRPCPGGGRQIRNDPYSPQCLVFEGDNGGATARGVAADRIRVSVRLFELAFAGSEEGGPLAAFAFDKGRLRNTIAALFDYFNQRFQFYGRRMEPVFFDGKGDVTAEFSGAGQEGAEADAVRVADEIKPFAELLAITNPYADALSGRQVTNFGAPFMSRKWYEDRRPYAWSTTADCTFVLEAASDYLIKRVVKRPAAHAGGDLRGKPRALGLLAPENPEYQACTDIGERALRAAGAPPVIRISYKFDFNTLSNQAAGIVAKLRNAGVTSVVCGCDPVLPIFLSAKAQEQSYQPEWLLVGAPFSDTDPFGQAYQQDQWSRAWGLSFLGTPQPVRASYGYFAFKAVRPEEEPVGLVDYLYYQLYPLALGIQMAGPNLTPESFEAGLYRWPGATGPAGGWRFTPGRHNPVQDAREIYWDRRRRSPSNGAVGSYVETEPGRRYRPGEWPSADPAVFPG